MIRREFCVYDKAQEIIDYIKNIALKFNFSKYEEKIGHALNDNEKYLIIKNLYSLYALNRVYQESIQSNDPQSLALKYQEEYPSVETLQAFKEDIGEESMLEEKIGVNTLGVKRLISSGVDGKISTAISTWLKNLGMQSSGYAAHTSIINPNSGSVELTNEQIKELQSKVKATSTGKQAKEFFIAQMKMIDSLINTDGSVNGIMVFFTDNKQYIDNNQAYAAIKYANEMGITALVNPTPELIRSTIYSLNHQEGKNNNITTIYIESDPKPISLRNSKFQRKLKESSEIMFDALFRPYSAQDSMTPKGRSEMYMNFDFTSSTRHLNLAKSFKPVDRMKMTKLIATQFSDFLTRYVNGEIQRLEDRRMSDRSFAEMENEEDFLRKLKDKEHGRTEFIKKYGAYVVFKKLHDQFQGWVNLSEQKQFDILRKKPQFANLSDASIKNLANERTQMFKLALQRDDANGIDNFAALFEEASIFIARSERLRVEMNPSVQREEDVYDTTYDEDEYGVLQIEDINNLDKKEQQPKDGWMVNFRETSSFDSLSKIVRNIIDHVPLLNREGKQEYFLGYPQYLDSNYVHALLIDKLHNIYDDQDVLPTL